MNMDVDYMVRKSRIQAQLQEAAKVSRNQKQESKEAKTDKSKIGVLLMSVMKMVTVGK